MKSPIPQNTIERVKDENQLKVVSVSRNRKFVEGSCCRICFGGEEDGELFSPCKCIGTMKYVHVECLQHWRAESSNVESYYRCEQCLYHYNLKRVTASRFLGLSFVVPLLTLIIMIGVWSLVAFICYISFGSESLSAMFGLPPLYAAAFAGLCVIGLSGFILMAFTEGGPDLRDPCGCGACAAENSCCRFCAGDCNFTTWELPSNAEGCLALAAALLVVIVVAFGIVGTALFVYSRIHALALGTRDRLSTVVLEVREMSPPPSPVRSMEQTPLIRNGGSRDREIQTEFNGSSDAV